MVVTVINMTPSLTLVFFPSFFCLFLCSLFVSIVKRFILLLLYVLLHLFQPSLFKVPFQKNVAQFLYIFITYARWICIFSCFLIGSNCSMHFWPLNLFSFFSSFLIRSPFRRFKLQVTLLPLQNASLLFLWPTKKWEWSSPSLKILQHEHFEHFQPDASS